MSDETNLRYEETPVIDPNVGEVVKSENEEPQETPEGLRSLTPEAARVFGGAEESHPVATSPPIPKKGKGNHIGTLLFITILFGLGIWLASQFRSLLVPPVSEEVVVPTSGAVPTSRLTSFPLATPSGSQANSAWQTYEVISGSTKKPVSGISYQLPADVKAPACDSTSCASQGTNLPGGTRFTVAARGRGQLLPDFRGAILTDATGKEFDMQQTTVAGISVYEYSGDFTGRTGGGYTFTRIRGVLIPVSETLAIEFNHFAPAGIVTDFVSDDVVFNKVIGSFTATGYVVPSPTLKPTVSLPTATPATTSGF